MSGDRDLAGRLVAALNAFDTVAVLALFAPDAIIDDPSTGEVFPRHSGIRDYVERFFLGYHTVTRILSLTPIGPGHFRLRVDFTGDFGHEIGLLDIATGPDGRIARIDADLE